MILKGCVFLVIESLIMPKRDKSIVHQSMRGYFAFELYNLMEENKNIFLLTGDLGWGVLDAMKNDFPDRFTNTGAAEQTMLDMAVGIAQAGKIPVVYSITPFLLYRPFETIRTYINHEKIPVKLIGSGRNKDYEHDGWSHDATDAMDIMGLFPKIKSYWPESKEEVTFEFVKEVIESKDPVFLSLRR